ncbi:plexin-B-like, partial [Mercenaria mercenaria]|uniref:plexin-B-like n=1 Tax=Mercenaria mercenaria TaxID=6596 RepID=UPI00234F45E7
MNLPVYCSLFLQVAAAFVIAAVSAKHNLKESKRLSGPLTNLEFHNDLMYIGGRNKIYALDKNLNIISSVNTCDGKEQDCNNINKVLVVDPTGNRLITCGTGKGGICELRGLDNLNSVQPLLISDLTVSIDSDKPAVGMITSNEKFVFAVTFGSGIEKKITKVSFETYNYAISTTDILALRLKKWLNLQIHEEVGLENYIIYYKKCLQHAGFSYLVTNQRKEVDRSSSEYVSKFIRICQNDTDYNSYADIVITCGEYNLIQDAILVNSENGSKIFMGIFTKNLDPNRNSGDSVICGVKLEELDDAIEAAKKNFYINGCFDKDKTVLYLPNEIDKSVCPKNETPFQPIYFHCETAAPSFRYVTDSKSDVKFNMMFRLHAVDDTLTSLSSTVLNAESSVILAGTSTGNIIMMNFRNMSLAKYDMMSVDSSSTVNPVRAIYQEDDDTLFVMTTDRISKFASSNCSEFKTCEATIKGKNPLCGWCVYNN